MIIRWFGQACVQVKGQDKILVIDPFKNIGLRVPQFRADVVLITHDHYDHNNLNAVKPREGKKEVKVFKGAGEFEAEGILVRGIPAWHDDEAGKKRGKVFMYLIRFEGINLAHLGDIGQKKLFEEQLEALNNVDILFIPVGGVYTISAEEAFEITNQIDPKIVVPIHYKVKGLNLDLEGVEKFLELEGKSPKPLPELRIQKDNLPKEERQLILLECAASSA